MLGNTSFITVTNSRNI